jgi:Epoxide hydrolase N terminus
MTAVAEKTGKAIRPFRVDVPDEALADLRRRIDATRWPTRELVEDRSQGVQLATMQALCRYWTTEYDWRRCEARLNALPQFMTEIDGVDIHFIHVRSPHENALPLSRPRHPTRRTRRGLPGRAPLRVRPRAHATGDRPGLLQEPGLPVGHLHRRDPPRAFRDGDRRLGARRRRQQPPGGLRPGPDRDHLDQPDAAPSPAGGGVHAARESGWRRAAGGRRWSAGRWRPERRSPGGQGDSISTSRGTCAPPAVEPGQYTSLAFTEALLGLCAAESSSGRGWPPADRLVVWVMARATASKVDRPGEVITGPAPRDPAARAASPSSFGDVKAGRAVQPVPEGSNEAEEKGDVREEICA